MELCLVDCLVTAWRTYYHWQTFWQRLVLWSSVERQFCFVCLGLHSVTCWRGLQNALLVQVFWWDNALRLWRTGGMQFLNFSWHCLLSRLSNQDWTIYRRGMVSGVMVRAVIQGHIGQKNREKKIWKIRPKTYVSSRAAFDQPGPVSSILLSRFFSVRVRWKANFSETDPPSGRMASFGLPHLHHSYRL